ncbi:MAG: SusC/RagA family TonB-linked outer membrane protein [Saprospiraceae bacterium]|nr:SusC/RagA family TonB-linked outer membrane protein [Saprospiraceae bacterium]
MMHSKAPAIVSRLSLKLIYFLFLLLCSELISAQQLRLVGRVIDASNNTGLEGVVVNLKNSLEGTTTNTLGEFSLLIRDSFPAILQIRYTGYEEKEVELRSAEFLQISLEAKRNELEEVLVVSGYTVQKKSEFSGAVANIDVQKIQNRPAVSFDQLLGGQAPGIDVLQQTGVLNNTPVMRIRGINSITSGIFPLVVVDGVAMFVGSIGGLIGNNPLSDLNPNDIQSIDVLKDASAAAIYGSRAANGVMVITTKKGKKGRVRVHYDSWLSRSTPYNLPKLLGAEDYVMIKNEAMKNAGLQPGYALMYNPDSSIVNTSWYDVAYRPGISHSHNLSVSGANNTTQYFFSFGYTNQNSFIRYNEYERYSARLNIENKLNEYLSVGAFATYANGFNKGPNTGAISSYSLGTSSYNSEYITNEPLGRMTYVLPPNVPVYRSDGSYSYQNKISVGYGANNPSTIGTINAYNLAMVQKLDVSTSENNTLIGNFYCEWRLLKNLKLKSSYGINNLQTENISFLNPVHGGGASSNGVATNVFTTHYRTDWVNTLNYEFDLNDAHHLTVLAGYEQLKTKINSWGAQRSNITDPYYENYQGGFVNISPYGNLFAENRLLSYFSNMTYDFDKKYFFTFNFRRDGLSALAEGNEFGNFMGGSIGWNVAKENFFQNSSIRNVLDQFRIRASYGVVGNSEIGNYPAVGLYGSNTYGGQPTLIYSQTANPNLKWEASTKLDLGFNASLWGGKLQLEFDYYRNDISDLILKAPQALSAGIPGNFINTNVGNMYNTGIELSLGTNLLNKGSFHWDVDLNFSTLTNKVTKLISDIYVPSIFGVQNMTREGYSVGSIFAVPWKGVNPDNGLMMFQNREGKTVQYNHIGSPKWTYLDGTPAPAIDNYLDGVIQGPSLPKYFGGFNNTFRYKQFELLVNLTYAFGHLLYNGTRATNSDQRYFNNGEFIKERWTTPGQQTEIQKLYYGDNVSAGFSFSAASKVEKGDYVKLKNITLAYELPLKKLGLENKISSARAFVQAVNLYTITGYRGSDPEISINGNSIHSGKDQNVSPNAQVFSIGLNVGF